MPVIAYANGTQNAVIGTEHVLANISAPGTFTLHVNTRNMQAGDHLYLRVYQEILTGDTAGDDLVFEAEFDGACPVSANGKPLSIQVSQPIGNDLADAAALRCTLQQSAGVGRAFKWKVLTY